MRRYLLLAIAAALMAPNGAQAGWKTDRATRIATHIWGVCQDQLRIHFTPADPAWADSYGWAWIGQCDVYIDTTIGGRYWEPFCTTVIHETGHVAGLGHSDNPRSVMWGGLSLWGHRYGDEEWVGTDPRCRKRGRPYLTKSDI
jgi:hypothetical protein